MYKSQVMRFTSKAYILEPVMQHLPCNGQYYELLDQNVQISGSAHAIEFEVNLALYVIGDK